MRSWHVLKTSAFPGSSWFSRPAWERVRVLHLRTEFSQSSLTFTDDMFVVLLLITQELPLYHWFHSGSRGSALKEHHHRFREEVLLLAQLQSSLYRGWNDPDGNLCKSQVDVSAVLKCALPALPHTNLQNWQRLSGAIWDLNSSQSQS